MKSCILINGMRRSGNHAIIPWLAAHFPGGVRHYNNVSLRVKPLEERKSEIIKYGDQEDPVIFLSVEDKTLEEAEEIAHHFGFAPSRKINILRSYYNMVASRKAKIDSVGPKAWERGTMKLERCPSLWVDNAEGKPDWHTILFDNWVSAENYRRQVERRLLLRPGIDGDMDRVARQGGGSSFTGQKKVDKAVLNKRFKQVKVPEELLSEYIHTLNNIHFGWRL